MKPSHIAIRSFAALGSQLEFDCRRLLGARGVPGASISVVFDNHAYHLAYGNRSVCDKVPVTEDTAFNVGSCSKAFTSALLAAHVADGLLSWDDCIADHVPEFQLYDSWVMEHATFRDLSGNRLGLPREGLCEFGFHPEIPATHILENLKHTRPIHPFRSHFTYVNAGHIACALAAGRILNTTFLDALRCRLLEPLGMTSTSGGLSARSDLKDRAAWHVRANDEIVEVPPLFTDQYLGSGGIWMSSRDAVQWLRFQLNEGTVDGREIVPAPALKETHQAQTCARPHDHMAQLFYPASPYAAYCLGWAVSSFAGEHMICHSGSDVGITSFILLIPERKLGVSVQVNLNDRVSQTLAYLITSWLLGHAPRDWEAYFQDASTSSVLPDDQSEASAPLPDLDFYIGDYHHPADGMIRVLRNDDGLELIVEQGYKLEFQLSPLSRERFLLESKHPEVKSLIEAQRQAAVDFTTGDDEAKTLSLCLADHPRLFVKH